MIDIVFTDTHFGWKNNSMTWLNSQLDFIYKQLIPHIETLREKDNVRVIHCGDVFESRSTISTYVASKVVQAFKDIRKACDEFVIVCGNHDFYSPNSDTINTVKLFMSKLDVVIVDQQIYETEQYAFVPWYVWQNGCFETQAKYIFCHADILMEQLPSHCYGKTIFSGHIHTPNCNTKRNLYNLGSCYNLTFADSNQYRGYYVITDGKPRFYCNNTSIKFHRLYNDEILKCNITSLNQEDYVELYVSETNMASEEYIAAIKKFTERFTHLWIIPQVVSSTDTLNEGFTGYNLENIVEDIIPNELLPFYDKVKAKIKSQN